jgi:hypothetical protein
MCVSTGPADFTGTKIMLNSTLVSDLGHVHVLAYQNEVQSFDGPNAMLLHIPSNMPMNEANFIDTTAFPRILDDMVDAVEPFSGRGPQRSASFGAKGFGEVQVFTSGIYDIALAQNAADIPNALDRVNPAKRPRMTRDLEDLFRFYGNGFREPGVEWHVALFCFNNRRKAQPPPIMLWYEPTKTEAGRFRLPSLDCHTGAVPDLNQRVMTDHWLFLASDDMRGGVPVHYSKRIRDDKTAQLLPSRVHGIRFEQPMQNGDFSFSQQQAITGQLGLPQRLLPPAFQN